MAELLDDIRAQIDARISELRPLAQEADRLERALAALETATPSPARDTATPARRTGRPRTPRGRRRQVPMAAAVVDFIRANPGATAGDVARALDLKRNSTSTRLTQLAKSGALVKAQRGYAVP
jgi:cell division septum initiation protein DivIVA